MHYKLDVISHSVTLDLKMRDGLKRAMCYKPEVRISPQEYDSMWVKISRVSPRFQATSVARNLRLMQRILIVALQNLGQILKTGISVWQEIVARVREVPYSFE